MGTNDSVYALREEVQNSGEYAIATYYLKSKGQLDIQQVAAKFAIGQTIGTWIDVPNVSAEMRRKYQGKIVGIIEVPPRDVSYEHLEQSAFLISIAFPHVNFGNSFAALLTTLLGNDASTSVQAKLVDLQFPEAYVQRFPGPQFGSVGLRERVGVQDRPLLLNMIKPCLGFPAEVGAQIFYDAALGGVDIIKDDELLTNPDYVPLMARVKAYTEARDRAYENIGKRTAYFANVTDRIPDMIDNAKRAIEHGADGIMVNFVFSGLDVLAALAADKDIDCPILAHYAGSGPWIESTRTGIDSLVYLGKLARLAGADIVLYNTPYGGYPYVKHKYMQMGCVLSQDFYTVRPAVPSIGGGVTPGVVPTLVSELGKDIVIAAGGGIQGHPRGAAAGATAMRQAIDAAVEGISLSDKAQTADELRIALDQWGELGVKP